MIADVLKLFCNGDIGNHCKTGKKIQLCHLKDDFDDEVLDVDTVKLEG